jgi:hypothetical protein
MQSTRLACVVMLLVACSGGDDGGDDAGDDTPTTSTEMVDLSLSTTTNLDILFVVDDSRAVLGGQQHLALSMQPFLTALQAGGVASDLHIGVVSSTVELPAKLGDANCDGPDDGLVLGDPVGGCPAIDGSYVTTSPSNVTGELDDALGCAVYLGQEGCGFEQPLEAMKRAIETTTGEHAGFLRAATPLAVIIAMDEDDCSIADPAFLGPESPVLGPIDSFRCFEFGVTCDEPDPRAEGPRTNCRSNESSPYLASVQSYLDVLEAVRPGGQVSVHAIIGDPSPVEVSRYRPQGATEERPDLVPSCRSEDISGDMNFADPGVRLAQLANELGERGSTSTWCSQEYDTAMAAFGDRLNQELVGQPCLLGAPTAAVPECTAQLVHSTGAPAETLPACDASATNAPCWRFVENPIACPTGSHFVLEAVGVELAQGLRLVAECDVVAP